MGGGFIFLSAALREECLEDIMTVVMSLWSCEANLAPLPQQVLR